MVCTPLTIHKARYLLTPQTKPKSCEYLGIGAALVLESNGKADMQTPRKIKKSQPIVRAEELQWSDRLDPSRAPLFFVCERIAYSTANRWKEERSVLGCLT
ncbi:hypothetical protein WG66_014528 [Moniliophthora roreri]|nr:hypothetical protein WG66_014528 [Moniliophthora roreri]